MFAQEAFRRAPNFAKETVRWACSSPAVVLFEFFVVQIFRRSGFQANPGHRKFRKGCRPSSGFVSSKYQLDPSSGSREQLVLTSSRLTVFATCDML